MLYELGRKYDLFPKDPPDQIEGTTLAAALRGLRLHGVCSEATWKRLGLDSLTTIPDELAVEAARNRPAEIVPVPVDIPAIQAALVRDGPVVVAAAITKAWEKPVAVRSPQGGSVAVIRTSDRNRQTLGGHAFAIAGYNDQGFLVQNSWGPRWGRKGFATWPYADVAAIVDQIWAIRLLSSASSLAGYQSDGLLGIDRLGITPDVKAIASLITARAVKPPLAFGLFGDWGSGKSFFMERLQEQIAHRASEAAERGTSSPFCSSVVQIRFNAWHYLDANLWASLVSEILEELFNAVSGEPTGDEIRATIQSELTDANGLFNESQSELAAARKRSEAATAALETARNAASVPEPNPKLALAAAKDAVAADPEVMRQVGELATQVGQPSSDAMLKELQQPIAEVSTWPARLARLWKWLIEQLGRGSRRDRLRRAASLTLIVAAPTVAAIVLTRAIGWSALVPLVTAIVGFVIALGPYISKVGGLIAAFEAASARIEAAEHAQAKAIVEAQEQARDAAVAEQARLEERARMAEARVRELETSRDDLEPARQIHRFLEERVTSQAYSSRVGLVSLIRRDFERLSELMEQRERRIELEAAAPAQSTGEPAQQATPTDPPDPPNATDPPTADDPKEIPIDRIVLYIDDLDRCKPRRVIEVLEAVHLLLAFRLFVVVVAVDPRWLRRCLEDQYRELLSGQPPAPSGISEGLTRMSTPQDYLEKIFQIPFYLRPIKDQGFVGLVGDLVGQDVAVEGPLPGGYGPDSPSGSDALEPRSSLPDPDVPGPTPNDGAPAPDIKPPPVPDLEIERLVFNRWEVEDMQRLSPLFRTPRATKRFVNTYRLIRSTIAADERPIFEGTREAPGSYRDALLLLSVVSGYPNVAPQLLLRLADASKDPATTWASFVQTCQIGPESPILDPSVRGGEWEDLCEGLTRIGASPIAPRTLAQLRPWIPRVARYSFSVSLPGTIDELVDDNAPAAPARP